LDQIEAEIRANITDYEGTPEFRRKWVREVFMDKKVLKFDSSNPWAVDDPEFERFISGHNWFAYNTLYGSGEEKDFVHWLDRQMQKLQALYEEIYLLRNEGFFAIYNFTDGHAFQPDFVLFLRQKNGETLSYQLFIEPKGEHIADHDLWKDAFLKEITATFDGEQLVFESKKYRLIGLPFYNHNDENKFGESFDTMLNLST